MKAKPILIYRYAVSDSRRRSSSVVIASIIDFEGFLPVGIGRQSIKFRGGHLSLSHYTIYRAFHRAITHFHSTIPPEGSGRQKTIFHDLGLVPLNRGTWTWTLIKSSVIKMEHKYYLIPRFRKCPRSLVSFPRYFPRFRTIPRYISTIQMALPRSFSTIQESTSTSTIPRFRGTLFE